LGHSAHADPTLEPTGRRMVAAADRLLNALDADQRGRLSLPFDAPDRLRRGGPVTDLKGLSLNDLTQDQRVAALGLVQTGLGESGSSRLALLLFTRKDPPGKDGDPDAPILTLYGVPGGSSRWGWRFVRPGLALHYTLEGSKVAGTTPALVQTDPEDRDGPGKGLRIVGGAEDPGHLLLRSLSAEQRAVAVVADQAPADFLAPRVPEDEAVGIAFVQLTTPQRSFFQRLIDDQVRSLPADLAAAWLAEVREAGTDAVRFAWLGPADPGGSYVYRLQGPTFLAETRHPAGEPGHTLTLRRTLPHDFGIAVPK